MDWVSPDGVGCNCPPFLFSLVQSLTWLFLEALLRLTQPQHRPRFRTDILYPLLLISAPDSTVRIFFPSLIFRKKFCGSVGVLLIFSKLPSSSSLAFSNFSVFPLASKAKHRRSKQWWTAPFLVAFLFSVSKI